MKQIIGGGKENLLPISRVGRCQSFFYFLPFFCCLNFYLFASDEEVYLRYPVNASVIQSQTLEWMHSDDPICRGCVINFQTRIRQDCPESVIQLPKEVEITILDCHKSEHAVRKTGGFDRELMNVPIEVLIEGDGDVKVSEKNTIDIVYSNELFHFVRSSFLRMTFALIDKPLVQGQVIETYLGRIPLRMTITEITQESVYVDIEHLLGKDEDEWDSVVDELGKGVWKRDNALIHEITLEAQFVLGEHSLSSRFRSVSKQD